MCFSKSTSIGAFVFGTLINVVGAIFVSMYNYKNKRFRWAILALWQFALLMQLPEAVQWHHIDRGLRAPASVETAAYWLNLLQPAAAYLVIAVVAFGVVKPWRIAAAGVLLLAFTIVAVVYCSTALQPNCPRGWS